MREPSCGALDERGRTPRRLALSLGVAGLAFLAACAGPARQQAAPPHESGGASAAPAAHPSQGGDALETPDAWRHQPLSWAKLERIERWLSGPAASDAQARAEAETELAGGLLEFAHLERTKLGELVFEQRLDRAEDLLQSALGSGAISAQQRERATAALAKVLVARLEDPRPTEPVAKPSAPAAPTSAGFPELITRAKWGARPANRQRLERHSGAWERLTIHHSADINGELAEQSAKDSALAVRKIQRYHLDDKRWGDIGYHFLIDPLGRIYEGRSLQWQGAHAGNNDLNHHNIGVCLLGQYLRESPPAEQLQALDRLVDALRGRYKIPVAKVVGHLELHGTDCPGPYLLSWVKRYRASAGGADPAAPLAPGRSGARASEATSAKPNGAGPQAASARRDGAQAPKPPSGKSPVRKNTPAASPGTPASAKPGSSGVQ
jgi:hypothetical protein